MNATTIIKEASTEGVTLALSATGTIKATGNAEAVARWIPAIREYKGEIIEALKAAVTEVQCWRVRIADHETTIATSGVTRAEVVAWYPDAVMVEPSPPPVSAPPTAAMTGEEESALRAWLAHIGETDPAEVANVVRQCQQDAAARNYFLGRAEAFEERAAIMEFDGGLTRAEAEREAAQDCHACTGFRRPGLSGGYCCNGGAGLALAYGERHPLRKLPDDHGANCETFQRFAEGGAVSR